MLWNWLNNRPGLVGARPGLVEARFERLVTVSLTLDLGDYGEAGAQGVVAVLLLEVGEVDADGDALDDFDVVAGGVLGWEEAELGAGGSADLGDLAVEGAATEGVDLDCDVLAGVHLLQLGFLEVGGDPEVGEGDDGEEILADAEVRADLNVLLVDDAGYRGDDVSVGEVEFSLVETGLGLIDVGEGGVGGGLLDLDLGGTVLGGLLLLGVGLGEPLVGLTDLLLRGEDLGLGLEDGGLAGGVRATAASNCCLEMTSFWTSGV